MKKENMLTGHPGKSLFFFAMPMILGNLFQQFYNMVDSIIVGKFVGENALAAVGASAALTTVFIMIAAGASIGAGVVTAQYLGAGSYSKLKTSVNTAILTLLGVGICLSIFGLLMNRSILLSLGTPDNIMGDALTYLQIYFLGLPFLFLYNILSSMFNALGDSKTPLWLLLCSSLLNILLDLLFVCSFGWGVAGVAVATVLAQGICSVAGCCLLFRRLHGFEEDGPVRKYDVQMLGTMMKIAVPSTLQQSIVSIGMLLVQSVVNSFGSSVLAGYSSAIRVENLCIVPMLCIGNALSTFTAQNLGAGQAGRVKKGYRSALGMAAAAALLLYVLVTLLYRPMLSLFIDRDSSASAYATGAAYLGFIRFFFIFIGLKMATDGVLRGAGDVITFTIANLVNLGIRVSVSYLLAPVIGVQAIWYAIPMGWFANFVISGARYATGKWMVKKVV